MEQFRTASAEQPSKSLGSDFYETPKNGVLVSKLKFHQNLGGNFSFLMKLFRGFSNY